MNLLDADGNIVKNAASIIDEYFAFNEDPVQIGSSIDFPCEPNSTQRKIQQAISNIQNELASSFNELYDNVTQKVYYKKIYSKSSRKISNLHSDFIPFAECIVAFIDQWCVNGGVNDGKTYGYEICSTTRSWHAQQNILTGNEYRENGLSWSLYGKGLSINVYYLEEDQLTENSKNVTFVKKCINFVDGSAKRFIEDAQNWFNSHKTSNGFNIKIYGVYPSIKDSIRRDKYDLINEYVNSDDYIFWGGLFSTYSNFTYWEYHPSLMPNEVWKYRQDFLNTSFVSDGNENILDLIESEESISLEESSPTNLIELLTNESSDDITPKYLSPVLELMQEDFISLYNLKIKINTSKRYKVKNLFKWAKENPNSLSQVITYHRISGDYVNSTLFYLISLGDNDIIYNDNNDPILQGSNDYFQLSKLVEGEYSLSCIDMFNSKLNFNLENEYTLPVDYMPDSSEFDLIDFEDYDVSIDPNDNEKMSDLASDEISRTSSLLVGNSNGVNEFGPISSIDVNPTKPLYNPDELATSISRSNNYNEMITPPEQNTKNLSRNMLDITLNGKRFLADLNKNSNELITPP